MNPRNVLRRSALALGAFLVFGSGAQLGTITSAEAAPAEEGQPPDVNPQERFAAAQRLFDQGDHAAALDVFREVYSITKSPNARLMVGHCLLRLGRVVDAYDELYRTMIEAGKRAESEPKYDRTRDAAATEVARLEPKVGKVIIAVGDPSVVDINVNGAPLAADRVGVPVAVDPGEIVVTARGSASKRGPIRLVARVAAGETKTLTVVLPDEAPASKPRSGRVVSASETASPTKAPSGGGFVPRGGVRTLGFVAAGVGALGMVTFGVAGSMVQGKLSTLEAECGSARCRDLKYASLIDSGKTLTAVTNVGLAVGLAGLAAGGAMIAFGGPAQRRSDASTSDASVSLRLQVLPTKAMNVALIGAF